MKRKLNLRKIITFGIYTLFIVLIIGCLIKIIFFNKKTVDVKVVNEIEKYNYSLNNNATAYYKSLFEELKNLLENDYNIEDYVKLVSKLFVTDVYTLDNKLNKNDLKVVIKMNKEINNNLPLNIIDIFNALENNFSKIYTVD